MNYIVACLPSYSVLEVELEVGDQLVSETGAMVWKSDNLKVNTSVPGGVRAGISRSAFAGESFFQNTYEVEGGGSGLLGLAPGQPGDIVPWEMNSNELFLEKDAYLASTPDIRCDSNFQGLSGLFNEGIFVLRVSGTGTVFFSAYGDVEEIRVNGSYLVDNGHAVAWEPSLQYEITRARRVRSFLFSDQLLLKFTGQGRLWVQSRNPRALASWVYPFRRVERKTDNK